MSALGSNEISVVCGLCNNRVAQPQHDTTGKHGRTTHRRGRSLGLYEDVSIMIAAGGVVTVAADVAAVTDLEAGYLIDTCVDRLRGERRVVVVPVNGRDKRFYIYIHISTIPSHGFRASCPGRQFVDSPALRAVLGVAAWPGRP